jgi:hypothetical protein
MLTVLPLELPPVVPLELPVVPLPVPVVPLVLLLQAIANMAVTAKPIVRCMKSLLGLNGED